LRKGTTDDGQEKVGAPIMANRVLSLVKKMFNFALDREWIDANPARSAQASITGDTP
jgi:site-specific recombinase XerD